MNHTLLQAGSVWEPEKVRALQDRIELSRASRADGREPESEVPGLEELKRMSGFATTDH